MFYYIQLKNIYISSSIILDKVDFNIRTQLFCISYFDIQKNTYTQNFEIRMVDGK